jgi:hypothetical protein
MDNNELTPEQQARVDEIRIALEQEMREPSPGHTARKPISDIEELKGDMLEALRHVLKFSQNESLKSKVAMWGYEQLLAQSKSADDATTKFFEELANAGK